ncbi:hypothetical protein V4R08_04890 [Nitrobacter sp. NHB1]|uniref:hypothetical protein n=1 Tax=Nitrobacter sp. NHB1 TaxID=3119830 RepID=UPI002FFE1ADE
MMISRSNTQTDIRSLEAAAASARSGFACIFSSSDEYEHALITERRARGRYAASRSGWPTMALIVLAVTIAGTVAYCL